MGILTDKQQKTLIEFVKFVKEELGLKKVPEIRIESNRNHIKTTANYNYTLPEKIIRVYGKGRALVDIMRSVSHELVHHKQWEDGRLEVKPADIGSEEENEANAIAGIMIKKFALKNPNIYED